MGSSNLDPLTHKTTHDQDVLTELLKEHAAGIRQRLAGKIPSRWQSVLSLDDIMQQTYVDAFLGFDQFVPGGEDSFAAWLFTIANRNLIDALRMLEADKRGGDRWQALPAVCDDSLLGLYELLGVTDSTPSRLVARGQACSALERALQRLPEDYRQVVRMFDLEGRPMAEVAQVLGRSPGAAYMLRERAHSQLRAALGNVSTYLSRT